MRKSHQIALRERDYPRQCRLPQEQPLQLGVLIFQRPQSLGIAHAVLVAKLRNRNACFVLLQNTDDLLF